MTHNVFNRRKRSAFKIERDKCFIPTKTLAQFFGVNRNTMQNALQNAQTDKRNVFSLMQFIRTYEPPKYRRTNKGIRTR